MLCEEFQCAIQRELGSFLIVHLWTLLVGKGVISVVAVQLILDTGSLPLLFEGVHSLRITEPLGLVLVSEMSLYGACDLGQISQISRRNAVKGRSNRHNIPASRHSCQGESTAHAESGACHCMAIVILSEEASSGLNVENSTIPVESRHQVTCSLLVLGQFTSVQIRCDGVHVGKVLGKLLSEPFRLLLDLLIDAPPLCSVKNCNRS